MVASKRGRMFPVLCGNPQQPVRSTGKMPRKKKSIATWQGPSTVWPTVEEVKVVSPDHGTQGGGRSWDILYTGWWQLNFFFTPKIGEMLVVPL